MCASELSSFKRIKSLDEVNAFHGADIRMDERINETPPKAPRLLDQVRDSIRRRHYSPRTEETYVHWIKQFIYFHGKRHPMQMGEAEVTAFLNHLAREREVAASTQNQAFSAILFLYKQALAWLEGLERAKRPGRGEPAGPDRTAAGRV